MAISRLQDIPINLNWLIYADSGNGKTTFSSTMALHPAMSPVLHINIDGGITTIRDMDLPEDSISVESVDTTQDLEDLFWMLKKGASGYEKFKSCCIDNSTECAAMGLEETVRGNMGQTSRSGKKRASIDDAWLEDRGSAGNRVGRIFRWYRDLPMHVVYTAHVRREFPKKDNVPDVTKPPLAVYPDLAPALLRRMEGYVDFIWYLARRGDKVAVLTQPRGPYTAKTRGVRNCKAFGYGFEWPDGFPLMPALYETIVNRQEFELPIREMGESNNKENENGD